MLIFLRFLTALFGLAALLLGLGWWVHPTETAPLLGAALLEGTGRSTQIGDSGALFIGVGALLMWGAIKANAQLILVGGCLVGLVMPGRILSAFVHEGAWTTNELAGESIVLAVAIVTAYTLRQRAKQGIIG